ncbi:MAG: cupin domain-containing protein, partial [Lacisediminimonas sp.]|nr:cupin domain-containing protein [Lacisediminimonas sp.]
TPEAHYGHKQRYVNPATGRSPMPTMAAVSQLIPAGFETRPYRCTDGTVYVCLSGGAEATVEGKTVRLDENDVMVVPSWHRHQFRAGTETVLFSYSDRPVQQALGLWREHRA